jgi:mycoredoxin
VRSALDRSGVEYEYVNIRQDESGRDRVREINGGLESVPTLVFSDGTTLTEPSKEALEQKLASIGGQPGKPVDPHAARLDAAGWLILVLAASMLAAGFVVRITALQFLGGAFFLLLLIRANLRGRPGDS